ncbi:MAG: hypothetical protein LRY27_02515 [Chitinophagales bacterium]|nr:hypothetical protein [Chitinophagales bacterium]
MKYVVVLLLSMQYVFAQTSKDNMSAHVYFLSDDRLEGRATGSAGEKIAQDYIASYFEEYGLLPIENNSYIQSFDFSLGKKPSPLNGLQVNGHKLELEQDYFPLNYSGNGSVNAQAVNVGFGIHAPGLYDDFAGKSNLKGKVFVINLSSPDGIHPHSRYLSYTDYQTRLKTAEAFGASAVIFYNNDENLDNPTYDLSMNVKEFSIPAVFVKGDFLKRWRPNKPTS